jgi:DNA gyrase subunit A
MNLGPGDELGWARATSGDQDFILVTAQGRALRFPEKSVRPSGRTSAGVGAVRLVGDDVVAGFDVVESGGDILVLTEMGWGKRTPLTEFRTSSRNTQGVWALAHSRADVTGRVAAARVVQRKDQVTIITSNGVALRTQVLTISRMGRMTSGVRIVNLEESDTVAAMARMLAEIEHGPEQNAPSEPVEAEADVVLEPILSVVGPAQREALVADGDEV